MKGSQGAQVSPHNKGLNLERNSFIILCFVLRSCHGSFVHILLAILLSAASVKIQHGGNPASCWKSLGRLGLIRANP